MLGPSFMKFLGGRDNICMKAGLGGRPMSMEEESKF